LKWPETNEEYISDDTEAVGDLAVGVISAVRGFKTKNQMSQKAELSRVVIHNGDKLKVWTDDLKETLKVKEIVFEEGLGDIPVENTEITLSIEK
jgi:valyl-tRNA synthetase